MRETSLSRQLIAGVLLAELICAALFSAVAVGTFLDMDGGSKRMALCWQRELRWQTLRRRRIQRTSDGGNALFIDS